MDWDDILFELSQNSGIMISEKMSLLVNEAPKIFMAGFGRSGLALRSFAMRLSQLGKLVFVVGETTTPAIGNSDLLIIATSSGENKQLLQMANIAQNKGAFVWLWSTSSHNLMAKIVDFVTLLPGKNKFSNKITDNTKQPMGSLFEQSVWLYGDLFTMDYMKRYQISEKDLMQKHANLE